MIPYAPPLPLGPARALDPFRIANQYGLFANMTHERYEIEFQGSLTARTGRPIPSATSHRMSTKRRVFMLLTSLVLNGTCGLPRSAIGAIIPGWCRRKRAY